MLFLSVVWVEIVPSEKIDSASLFLITDREVLSQTDFVLQRESGPLSGVGIEGVVFVRDLVLVLPSVNDELITINH